MTNPSELPVSEAKQDSPPQAKTSSSNGSAIKGLGYGDALDELEELLDELEDADIDVDRLADRVARGVELVRHCRARLAVVSGDVDQVVADLLTDEEGAQAESGD